MNSMKEKWIKYLKSFGTKRLIDLKDNVSKYIRNTGKLPSRDLEENLEKYNLWYMLYL